VYSEHPADLFSQLYDELPERLFAEDAEAEDWLEDVAVAEIASDVEREVVSTGALAVERLERLLDVDQTDRNRFAILRGLDLAFAQADITGGTSDTDGLTDLVLDYLETGRFSTNRIEGAVLPKYASPAQEHLLPQTLRDAFFSVVRVGPTPVPVEQFVLDDWPSRTEREQGLYVAALPAFDRTAPLTIEKVVDKVPCYRARLVDPEDPEAWVRERLNALDGSGASIGLLPELALTPRLVKAWSDVCRSTDRPPGSHLQWIVAGTGPDRDDAGVRPRNRAVVINRADGEPMWEQPKQFRFQLENPTIKAWRLDDELGDGPLEEWITPGNRLTVAEAPGFRGAVIVCEDLTEHDFVGRTANAWGIAYGLVCIFSQAIRRRRWEERHAAWLHEAHGISAVVCNSQWIGDTDPEQEETVGDVLVIGDQTLLGAAPSPCEPVVVRFTEHGAVIQE
jgi:predicted amidohydrolase